MQGAGGFGSATMCRIAQVPRMGAKVVIAVVSDERGMALVREADRLHWCGSQRLWWWLQRRQKKDLAFIGPS